MKSSLTITLTVIALIILIANTTAQVPSDEEFKKLNGELSAAYSAGNFRDALVAATRLVELTTQKFGKNDVALARALKNRGFVENALGDSKTAEKTLEESMHVFKMQSELTKSDGASFAGLLETLAAMKMQGNLNAGVDYLQLAIKWREKSHGPDAAQLAVPLATLANIRYWGRHYDSAAELYKRALAIIIKTDGDVANPSRSIVFSRTECTFRKAKKEDQFEVLRSSYKARFSPQETDKSTLMTGGVINGKAVSLPPPAYPAEAKEQRATGTVTIQVLIDEKGDVLTACAVGKSFLALAEASEIAAFGAKFSPTLFKGNPVKVSGIITYNFSL